MAARLPSSISAALLRGATVLTPNQRAARAIRRSFDVSLHEQKQTTWTPPDVLAFDTWLSALWQNLLVAGHETRLLLNRTQEHALWRDVIASDSTVSGLNREDSLATMAAQAFALLSFYGGNFNLPASGLSVDTRAFTRWAADFERRCSRAEYLPAAHLPRQLEHALSRGRLQLPDGGLALVDFIQQAPAHAQLVKSIARVGYSVEDLQTAAPAPNALCFTAPDDLAEVHAAATWIKGIRAQDPSARVAVVVSNLQHGRTAIERIFGETLAAEHQTVTAPASKPVFEFSLGRPLANTAPCAAALDLLRWTLAPLPLGSISALLVSGFLAAPEEFLAIAEFDAYELRESAPLRPELSLGQTIELLRGSRRREKLRTLSNALRSLSNTATTEKVIVPATSNAATPLQSHIVWMEAFRRILTASGWRAATERSSFCYQARERFERVLDEGATLDFDGRLVSSHAALQSIIDLGANTIFAVESQDAPIQILGPLELGGVPFDAVWMMGADDLAWPLSSSPSPLLPFQLQREIGVPGMDAGRDRLRAERHTLSIAGSAPSVVFSYALHGEERMRRLSSLVADLRLSELEAPLPSPQIPPLQLAQHPDDLPLPALPDQPISGGAHILQLQAACGFRAFAEHRLFSTDLSSSEAGLDALGRGRLVHRVMELFWQSIESQADLRALSITERHELLDRCIDEAVLRALPKPSHTWDLAYLNVQRERLRSLLRPWLTRELDRPPFRIHALEQKAEDVRVGPLRLNLRIDRIDETSGGLLIIDYKTGAAKTAEWLSDRPDSPQLPLYATLEQTSATPPESLGGIAFATLRAGKDMDLCGIAGSRAVLSSSSKMEEASFADQLLRWKQVLAALAADFASGNAAADPKTYPQTCTHCRQRLLCRLDPSKVAPWDEEDETIPTFDTGIPGMSHHG